MKIPILVSLKHFHLRNQFIDYPPRENLTKLFKKYIQKVNKKAFLANENTSTFK